ncbi:transcription antitermination factor NusB [Hornefia butyriciproducens]|nr:transcription antitermination factor NusB [Hornefia butyriciproducens]MCI7327298.1 transcription antitermination factor NusB [Clostridiales bacterium]MDD6299534.1 transcription antitermination factor NusB [Hornefia butyriciproducens]MDY2990163.1 transcription antitermination factor NusB [Hornefia butyriciproducens]
MTRREAREFMMKVLYQMDVTSDDMTGPLERYVRDTRLGIQKEYCESVYEKFCAHKEEIDSEIARCSIGWKIERMPRTDVSILRLSVCEILYMPDIPPAVSINEAVEITKKYGTDQSPKFVNAILGSIARERK